MPIYIRIRILCKYMPGFCYDWKREKERRRSWCFWRIGAASSKSRATDDSRCKVTATSTAETESARNLLLLTSSFRSSAPPSRIEEVRLELRMCVSGGGNFAIETERERERDWCMMMIRTQFSANFTFPCLWQLSFRGEIVSLYERIQSSFYGSFACVGKILIFEINFSVFPYLNTHYYALYTYIFTQDEKDPKGPRMDGGREEGDVRYIYVTR